MAANASSVKISAAVLIFILAAATAAIAAAAPASIGAVRSIKGGALERQDRDIWSPLLVNTEIRANDRIRTGPGATAVLSLNDVGQIMIGPNTEYYLGDPSREFKSLLKRGYLWFSTKLKPGSRMSVATTSAVAGVRGTKFSVIQDDKGMNVCTCKGAVEVMLKDGKAVSVTSGLFGDVTPAGTMAPPGKGKPHLEHIWKEKPARYAPCLDCHRKGKKIGDLS